MAPYLQKDLKLVERIQRLATRCAKGFRGLQYPPLPPELQLPSMQSHILRTMVIMAYNLFNLNLSGRVFRYTSCKPPSWASIQGPATPIPTRPTASSIRSSPGRAVEQTATLRRGSAIAKCVQGAARQLLGDNLPGPCLIPCKFIHNRTWFRHTSAFFSRPVSSNS